MKIFGRLVSIVLALIFIGFIFLYSSPDYNIYLVRSESMRPAINMGDLIITGPLGNPITGGLRPGLIVTYAHSKELVTHRIVSVDDKTLVTKGDAVEDADPWAVAISDVRGAYLFKIPYVGYATSYIRTKHGWFLAIILPGALLVGWLAKDIVKEAFSDTENSGGGDAYRRQRWTRR